MTSANTSEDLHQGRGWLNRAAEMLDSCEDHVSDAEFATAAAAIGSGFVALAQAQMSAPVSMRLTSEMPPALISAVERAGRAAAEARPHDDEPGAGTARLAALIGEGLVACEPHPLLHSYTQRYIASVLRGEQRRELTGLEADLNG